MAGDQRRAVAIVAPIYRALHGSVLTMRTKRLVLGMLPLLGFTALSGGCGLILGLDQFTEGSATSTSTSSSSGSTGGTGGMGTGGMGTGGGTSGTGGSMCVPSAVEACYDGPMPTRAVGTCKDGKHTCNPDGSGWGACVGAVLPKADDCSTTDDENCDGVPCSETLWAKRFGDDTSETSRAVTVDAAGNIYVVGDFGGTMKFGSTAPLIASGTDIFVAKLDPAGKPIWAKQLGAGGIHRAYSIARDASGNLVLAGTADTATDYGGGADLAAGIFVVKLDPAGAHVWSKTYGGATNILGGNASAAVDAKGDVLLAASFEGTVNFDGAALTSMGSKDIALAKLSGVDGSGIWSHRFGDALSQRVLGIALDTQGSAIITGSFNGSVDFTELMLGNQKLVDAGQGDIFTAKFDTTGKHSWSSSWGDTTFQQARAIAVDSLGGPMFTGSLGTSAFGLTSVGSSDALVAKRTSSGQAAWANSFGNAADPGDGLGFAIAADATGGAVFGGWFNNTISFGSTTFTSTGKYNAFVTRLDGQGALIWSRAFGDSDINAGDSVTGIALAPGGEVIMIGNVAATVDFGPGPLAPPGHVFVAKLAP